MRKWFRTCYPNLRAECARRDIGVGELGKIIGVSVPQMRRRLVGKSAGGVDMSAFECARLCEYFNIPFEVLFSLEGESA